MLIKNNSKRQVHTKVEKLSARCFLSLKIIYLEKSPIQQLSLHKQYKKQLYKIKVKRTSGCLKNDNRYEKKR